MSESTFARDVEPRVGLKAERECKLRAGCLDVAVRGLGGEL
jgi:hypothetical protein